MYIAKHLVNNGSEVTVGSPIMITVDNKEDVDKFASYTVPVGNVVASPKPVENTNTSIAAPVATPPSPSPPSSLAAVVAPPPPPKPAKTTPAPAKEPAQTVSAPVVPQAPWGSYVKKSPLSLKLSLYQKEYIEKYGSSLHEPVSS